MARAFKCEDGETVNCPKDEVRFSLCCPRWAPLDRFVHGVEILVSLVRHFQSPGGSGTARCPTEEKVIHLNCLRQSEAQYSLAPCREDEKGRCFRSTGVRPGHLVYGQHITLYTAASQGVCHRCVIYGMRCRAMPPSPRSPGSTKVNRRSNKASHHVGAQPGKVPSSLNLSVSVQHASVVSR